MSKTEEAVYTEVTKLVKNEGNVLDTVVNVMKLVDNYKHLTGDQKRNLVTKFVQDNRPEDISRETLLSFIEIVISASKGMSGLNSKKCPFFKKFKLFCK